MNVNKPLSLITIPLIFLFIITITGMYAWFPIVAENSNHHHKLIISDEQLDSSEWSLVHNNLDQKTHHIKKSHHWKYYKNTFLFLKYFNENQYFLPLFILSSILIIRTQKVIIKCVLGKLRLRPLHRNSYVSTKELIVLRN